MKEKDREIAESKANCGELSNSLRDTASKLVEAQKRLSEMSSRTEGTSFDALGQMLADAKSQRDRLQKNLKEKCARMEELEKRLQQRDEAFKGLCRDLEHSRVVSRTWSNHLSEVQKQLKEKSSEIEQLQARLARTEDTNFPRD